MFIMIYLSWNDMYKMCEALAKKVGGYSPDVLIGLSRGGLVPVRIMSDLLGVSTIYILRVSSYDKDKKTNIPAVLDYGCKYDIRGKNLLVVDDVADTGESLRAVDAYLRSFHPKTVKYMTLHYKPHSVFKPDYFEDTTTEWIVYPWEIKEMKE